MRKISLTDGTVYSVAKCGADGNTLMIELTDTEDFLPVCMKFGRPENVQRIEHLFEGTETDHVFFDGFTTLTAVSLGAGSITVVLVRE